MLLPVSGCLQRAAHLGETSIDVSAEVAEVLTGGSETRRRSVSEVAELGSDLGGIPVGRLQCVNAPPEIVLTHRVETTGAISAGVPLIAKVVILTARPVAPISVTGVSQSITLCR